MLYSPTTDQVLFEATRHMYRHGNDAAKPFTHRFLPGVSMTPAQRDQFVDKSILHFIVNHDPRAGMGAVPSDDASKPGMRIAAFTTSGAIVQPDRQVITPFADQLYYDDYWRRSYMPITLIDERVWEIPNVNNTVEMDEIAEGGQVRTQRVTATKSSFKLANYSVELGFTRDMLTGNRLSDFVTDVGQLRTAYWRRLAATHYAPLVTAATASSQAEIIYQGADTQSTLVRDIATLNAGLGAIETSLQDVDPEHVMMGTYIVYVKGIQLKGRMVAAMQATVPRLTLEREAGASSQTVQRQIEVISTLNSNVTANKAFVVLAGRKIQSADGGARSYQVLDPKSENLCRMLWAS